MFPKGSPRRSGKSWFSRIGSKLTCIWKTEMTRKQLVTHQETWECSKKMRFLSAFLGSLPSYLCGGNWVTEVFLCRKYNLLSEAAALYIVLHRLIIFLCKYLGVSLYYDLCCKMLYTGASFFPMATLPLLCIYGPVFVGLYRPFEFRRYIKF